MISNEELLLDIENTKKELQAYKQIAEGFTTLSTLPENDAMQKRGYMYLASLYIEYQEGCSQLLINLSLLEKSRRETNEIISNRE